MTVRLLEEHVVNQIAAGEVIERPASVVKELVENALDAGATTLEVLLTDGGKQRIRVRDNGHGMGEQDAMMAMERHATSKIRHATDLACVRTMGFRGEALPSIAAVSRFQLVTRAASEESGTQLRVEGGTLTDVRQAGVPVGTEIDVRSLFFNVPARRKFLRTTATELSHCLETVVRVALMRPDVDFTVRHGDRELLRAPVGDLARRAADVLGPDARTLLPIDASRDGVEVRGLAARPGDGRTSASGALYLYVNGRWVRDIVLRRAVYQAYRDLMPKGRYPLVVLDVHVPDGDVDVNVHPTKAEVRFVNPRDVTAVVADSLRTQVLSGSGQQEPRHRPMRGGYQVERPSLPLNATAPMFSLTSPVASHPDDDPRFARIAPPAQQTPQQAPTPIMASEPSNAEAVWAPTRPDGRLRAKRLVGLIRGRWLALEDGEGLVLVDGARAAMAAGLARDLGSTRLLMPARVTLSESEVDTLLAGAEHLGRAGLDLARFGPTEVAVRAVPVALIDADPAQVVRVAAEALSRGGELAAAWVGKVQAAPLIDDEHELRTLVATIDELGLPVACKRLEWGDLP